MVKTVLHVQTMEILPLQVREEIWRVSGPSNLYLLNYYYALVRCVGCHRQTTTLTIWSLVAHVIVQCILHVAISHMLVLISVVKPCLLGLYCFDGWLPNFFFFFLNFTFTFDSSILIALLFCNNRQTTNRHSTSNSNTLLG